MRYCNRVYALSQSTQAESPKKGATFVLLGVAQLVSRFRIALRFIHHAPSKGKFMLRRAFFHLLILSGSALFVAGTAQGQVIFGADIGDGTNPLGALFRAENGVVAAINTGLPNPQFPSLSPQGNLLVISSPDPAAPNEASTDLFAFDLVTGQTRKLVDNVTETQPDGSNFFASPLFSATETNGQRVAYVNQLASSSSQGGGAVRQLSVVRASDGFDLALAEIGQGNAIDFYQSEFVGIDWSPISPVFATSGYVPVTTNAGRQTFAAGIVLFGETGPGSFGRVGQLTQPVVTDQVGAIIVETHAYPAFSADGQQLAFFRITFPSPLMTQPAQADLIVIDVATGSGIIAASFPPGQYPLGVSWRDDDELIYFSAGTQVSEAGQFPPIAVASTAQMYTVTPNGSVIGGVAGAPNGYFPNAIPLFSVVFRDGFEN